MRNNNGSQFIAAEVQALLQRKTSSKSSANLPHHSKTHALKAIIPSWKAVDATGSDCKKYE
ncbi:hypothetical protein MVI27_02735 [Chryseobacterium salipaludis]|uniref:hypothetical protein n=1 Tax=Chryseobacterium TaxID=59732 RepID=UPI001FF1AAC7|nr:MULTISPECIES: hypothetical protein [Chryseobacterium]MCJ8497170.1 hypothetical protein [Chryseobacterium salipaludis]MCX3295577.1 hypothetical protein [Planobacterium sp. JC490]